jgi:hypothetical protein
LWGGSRAGSPLSIPGTLARPVEGPFNDPNIPDGERTAGPFKWNPRGVIEATELAAGA